MRCAIAVLGVTVFCAATLWSCNDCGGGLTTDAGDASAMDGSVDDVLMAACEYATCDGSARCPPGATCLVGDGCNTCYCPALDSGYPLVSSCTKKACNCSTCGQGDASCTLDTQCCSSLCEGGTCQ